MEIPIQVAVRICPRGPKQRQEQQKDLKKKETVEEGGGGGGDGVVKIEDNNGNLPENGCLRDGETKGQFCVRAVPFTGGLPGVPPPGCMDPPDVMQVGPHSFPVTHALPLDCSQNQVYRQTVLPLMSLFMEGFDASVVAYGQKGCGKTYALYGNGFNDPTPGIAEDQGVVARCVEEIFLHIDNHPERTCAVNITWIEICREIIRDIFGVGSVQCMTMTDALHWLQVGYKLLNSTRNQMGHSLFSITLEQRWISREGVIQHRLSTASFTDLGATERLMVLNALGQPAFLPKDLGLQSLECVVSALIDPALIHQGYECVPYNRTMLTTMLKDSFGGRAQTLVMVCVSPWECDLNETIANMQFAFKVQCVHNFVVINSYSDDNTLATPDELPEEKGKQCGETQKSQDPFALQFAANQWSKLVSNAEDLLAKLISSSAIGPEEKQQIESWLIKKQECDDCFNSSDSMPGETALSAIKESEEQDDDEEEESDPDITDPETSLPENSENDSDLELQRPDIENKLQKLMQDFEQLTDKIIKKNYVEFFESHPKPVMISQETTERKPSLSSERGRRRSIQPGSALSSVEMALLQQIASREQFDKGKSQEQLNTKDNKDILGISWDKPSEQKSQIHTAKESVQKKLRKLETDIEARLKQTQEIQETIKLKQNIIAELIKTSETRSTAKQRFNKKCNKMQAEYEKSQKMLNKALAQQKDKREVERLKTELSSIEQRLNDVTSIKHIAGESVKKLEKLQQSLHESQTLMDNINKKITKEKKKKEALERELQSLREKEEENATETTKALIHKTDDKPEKQEEVPSHLQEVQSRLNHVNHVLKEKSNNLQQQQRENGDQREGLRHEIRNLRKTRDHLLDQRISLDRKFKRDKMLSQKEERKLLECDEAIEAIDAAIEFKNELICGHKSIDTSESLQREKGEQMLMARLNKLSNEEMRTLLYKYFTKVIDLRDSSRKLEMQLMQLEREKDAWEWKERVLSNAVRQAHLEGERKAVLLQRQHEMKLTLMLRHLAEETSNSSASYSDQSLSSLGSLQKPSQLALVPTTLSSINSSNYSDSDYEWPHHHHHQQAPHHQQKLLKIPSRNREGNMALCPLTDRPLSSTHKQPLDKLKGKTLKLAPNLMNTGFVEPDFKWPPTADQQHYNNKRRKSSRNTNDMELCPLPERSVAKYKSQDKVKEKETKNKLFAKFQVLTRYASNQRNEDSHTSSSNSSNKSKDKDSSAAALDGLSQENLHKSSSSGKKTKVTRQKNKLIIQDKSRRS